MKNIQCILDIFIAFFGVINFALIDIKIELI